MSNDMDMTGVPLRHADDVAAIVRSARARLGWTQQHLALVSGLTRQSINNLERRRSDLATSSLLAVLDALSLRLTVTPLASEDPLTDDASTQGDHLDELIASHTTPAGP